MREMATASEPSEAGKEGFPGWDDGGEYARAAEAAGVDVGGMLEAGVDARQLLDFVSNYRPTEGETPIRPSTCTLLYYYYNTLLYTIVGLLIST